MDSFRLASAAVSDRGLSEKRPQNEDSYLEMPERGIFAVADGVGGAQAGEVASQMAMEILGEAFANQADGADAEDTLRAAIERANKAIFQMANELPQLSSMATTIVALHLSGDIATIGHVGDSRLYRVDRDGNLHRETADHSMVADEVRAGRMTEEQAENHPSRNIISRALGAESTVEVDLKTIMIEPGTAFLICSDGITRHVGDEEIRGVLTFGGDATDICDYLKNLCYERGAEDNLTAVVVKAGVASPDTAAEKLPSIVPPITEEEPTIATARPPFDSKASADDPLELDTLQPETFDESGDDEDEAADVPHSVHGEHEKANVEAPIGSGPVGSSPSSMFSETEDSGDQRNTSDSIGTVAVALGMLVLGSLIGLAVYHFAIARTEAGTPGFQEMRTENIPFTTFEKNRRNVDADPAAYVKEIPPPDDAEDFYLLGRAYMLIGDFANAHVSLVEAQKRLPDPEQANGKVLATDIATALVITNDPSLQVRLKSAVQTTSTPIRPAAGMTPPAQ